MYAVRVSRRRQHRRADKARRHDQLPSNEVRVRTVVREAAYVERLAYTRSQAARALGLSGSTFARRVLPYVETLQMTWGATLIPVDEIERLVAQHRRQAAKAQRAPAPTGRPRAVPIDIVVRIRRARDEGMSFRAIADELTSDAVPTVHGGVRWWPSTVRAILERREVVVDRDVP